MGFPHHLKMFLELLKTSIYKIVDKKIFLWEHFGKIDDEEYVRKIFFKLQDYHNAGINLWDNLIITFDQADGSLNADYIDRIIKLYLL